MIERPEHNGIPASADTASHAADIPADGTLSARKSIAAKEQIDEIASSLCAAKELARKFETAAANAAQTLSDRLLTVGAGTDHLSSPHAPSLTSKSRFEGLLVDLRSAAVQRTMYEAAVSNLAAAAVARIAGGVHPEPQDLQRELQDDFPDWRAMAAAASNQFVMQRRLMQTLRPIRQSLQELAGEEVSSVVLEYRNALRLQNAFLGALSALHEKINYESIALDLRSSIEPSAVVTAEMSTRYIPPSDVESGTIKRLAELCAGARREPGHPDVKDRGIIVTPQTEAALQGHLSAGARIITLELAGREMGVAIFFEPANMPASAAKSSQHYSQFGSAAFVHLILVDPMLRGTPAHDMLLNATLIHLQRSMTEIAIGRVENGNEIARRAHYTNGWREMPFDTVQVVSPGGRTATFTGHYLPVSPQWREILKAPEIRASRSDWPTLGHLSQQVTQADGAERLREHALSQTALVDLLARAPHPAVVRFTGGCGEMNRRDWLGTVALFTEAFDGFEGAMLAGATRMLVKFDDGLSGNARGSICELPLAIQVSNSAALVGGICIGERSARMLDNHIVVDGSLDSEDHHITIKHPGFSNYTTADERDYPPSKRWDAEADTALAITERLLEQDFSACLISFNGGGTTRREILNWARRGLPVLLVSGSGRETDALASDVEFLVAHPSVFVVPRESQALREVLQHVGVLPEPSASPSYS